VFSHIVLGARDLALLTAFYDAALAPLGLIRAGSGSIGGRPGMLWRHGEQGWPQFCLQPPSMVCLRLGEMGSRSVLLRQHAKQFKQHGRPHWPMAARTKVRPGQGRFMDYMAPIVVTRRGNKLCFVHAGP
jgi:hypothetical protein